MATQKTLIFLEPLSDTSVSLMSVMEEGKEQDGLEILQIESLAEMGQITAAIGARLVVISEPKKCALLLKMMGKKLMKQNAKIVLVTPKKIPNKTLEKLMKFGLTECINEPIPPKSLLYKIKLFIRSLPNPDKESKELSLKSIEGGKKEEEGNQDKKFEKDKDENNNEETSIKEKKKAQEIKQEEYYEGDVEKKSEDLGGHYEGEQQGVDQVGSEDMVADSEDVSKNIETYYEGDLKEGTDKIEDEFNASDSTRDHLDGPLSSKLKRGEVGLDLEEDDDEPFVREEEEQEVQATKSVSLDMDLEEDDEDFNMEKEVQEGKEIKNKSSASLDLDLEDDNPDFKDEREKENLGPLKGKTSKQSDLDLEDDDDQDYIREKEEEKSAPDYTDKKESDLPLEEDQEDSDREAQEKESKEKKDPNEGKVDHIDKYYRNEAAKKEEEDQSQSSELKRASLDLPLEDSNESSELDIEPETLAATNKKDASLDMDLEEDPYQKKEKEEKQDPGLGAYHKKQKSDLKLESDYDINQAKEELKEKNRAKTSDQDGFELEDDDDPNKKIASNKDQESEKSPNKHSQGDQNIDDGWGTGKKNAPQNEQESKDRQGPGAKEAQDQNWDGLGKNDPSLKQEDFPKDQHQKEMIIEKEVRGEQTIDYGRLKEEFDIIQKYGHGAIKEAYKFGETGGQAASVKFQSGKVPYVVTITEEGPPTLVPLEEEEQISEIIYHPDSKGLEHAIEILSYIEDKKLKDSDIIAQISNTILSVYGGHSIFYRLPYRGKDFDIIYQSDTEFMREEYPQLSEEKINDWKAITLPTWSDETFREYPLYFCYPYYEGTQSMGLALVFFEQEIKAELAPRVEVLLECARCLYLQEYHGRGYKGQYKGKQSKPKEQAEGIKTAIGGFFGRLFGKKAS